MLALIMPDPGGGHYSQNWETFQIITVVFVVFTPLVWAVAIGHLMTRWK